MSELIVLIEDMLRFEDRTISVSRRSNPDVYAVTYCSDEEPIRSTGLNEDLYEAFKLAEGFYREEQARLKVSPEQVFRRQLIRIARTPASEPSSTLISRVKILLDTLGVEYELTDDEWSDDE